MHTKRFPLRGIVGSYCKWSHITRIYRTIEPVKFVFKFGQKVIAYPHSFRHLYAKNFLGKFNDIAFLADLMGHESIETTRIYLRRTACEQREIVDKIITW